MGALSRLAALLLAGALLWKDSGALRGSSCQALVAYPWLFLAGLPRATRAAKPLDDLAFDCALLLPLLALARRIDTGSAAPLACTSLLDCSLPVLGLFALLHLGAGLASRGGARAQHAHGCAWLGFVVLVPLALAMWSWGEGQRSSSMALCSQASALGWIHARVAGEASLPWLALATSAGLLGLSAALRERGGHE